MQEMAADQVTPNLMALFDFTKPTMPRAFNVLEGTTRGHIVADDPSDPTWAVVRDGTYGTLYFGGKIDASVVAYIVKRFRPIGEVGIGCWLDDKLNEMIPSDHQYDGRTLYFRERASNSNDLVNTQFPSGYTLSVRDEALFQRSFDYESTLISFGSVEAVMRETLGMVILHNNEIACEAATGAPTHGWIEVGVTSAESHRRRGLATIACAHLIEACEAKGYKTWWDCAKQNVPSVRLAHRLGYQNEREYRYVWWPQR